MAKNLYLSSLRSRVGKTLLSLGIMQKLQKMGKSYAYFKPIGIPKSAYSAKADPDVGFILDTVYKTDFPYHIISPVSIPDCYYVDLVDETQKKENLQKIKDAYEKLSEGVDYVVIEGAPTIKKFIRVGLDDLTIAETIGPKEVIYIERESSDKCIDNLFFTKKYFDFRDFGMKGVLFNRIDYEYLARIDELAENHIKRYGVSILGTVEEKLELIAARVSEVKEAIGGELINESAASGMDRMVETYIIGAMNPQAALKYLRQVKGAACITGGDRSDLLLASLDEDVACLILTGFIQPDVKVISAANEKNVPIILSPSDTYTTLRNLERLKPGLQRDEVDDVLKLVEDSIDWDKLLE
ncbi:MAG: DRTGG domain-containing protein [Promethearchaeia archaeon]